MNWKDFRAQHQGHVLDLARRYMRHACHQVVENVGLVGLTYGEGQGWSRGGLRGALADLLSPSRVERVTLRDSSELKGYVEITVFDNCLIANNGSGVIRIFFIFRDKSPVYQDTQRVHLPQSVYQELGDMLESEDLEYQIETSEVQDLHDIYPVPYEIGDELEWEVSQYKEYYRPLQDTRFDPEFNILGWVYGDTLFAMQ